MLKKEIKSAIVSRPVIGQISPILLLLWIDTDIFSISLFSSLTSTRAAKVSALSQLDSILPFIQCGPRQGSIPSLIDR